MDIFAVVSAIFSLFSIVVVGCILVKLKLVSEKFSKDISRFLFNIAIPCTMVNSISQSFSLETLYGALKMLVYAVGFLALGMALSPLWLRLLGERTHSRRSVYRFTLTISNFGFMGWPISYALFGDTGLFYSSVFSIPINIIFYFYGGLVFGKSGDSRQKTSLSTVLSPPVVGTLVGLLFFITGIRLPEPLGKTVSMLGDTTIPLAMAVAGMMLASNSIRDVFSNKRVFIHAVIRLLVMPSVVFLVMKLIGETGLMLAIPVLIAAMPAPPNTTVLTELYGADSFLAAQVIFISTLLSVVTLPLIIFLFKLV